MWQAGEFACVIRFAVHHARMPHTLAVNHTRFCKKCGETHTRSISSQVQMSRAMAVKLVHNGCCSPVRAPHFSPSRRLQLRQDCLSLEVGKIDSKSLCLRDSSARVGFDRIWHYLKRRHDTSSSRRLWHTGTTARHDQSACEPSPPALVVGVAASGL